MHNKAIIIRMVELVIIPGAARAVDVAVQAASPRFDSSEGCICVFSPIGQNDVLCIVSFALKMFADKF